MGYRKAGIDFVLKSKNSSGFVFLIHGLFLNAFIMFPLARRLNKHGFSCFVYDYPTRLRTLKEHDAELAGILSALPEKPLSIVTHSMGGLLIRSALAQMPELNSKLHRIVMIAPPNKGSDAASYWYSKKFLNRLVLPLEDMRSEADSRIHTLPEPQVETGIIAAERDKMVTPAYSGLTGRERIFLQSSHSMILFRRDTADAVEYFLRNGCFRKHNTGEPI